MKNCAYAYCFLEQWLLLVYPSEKRGISRGAIFSHSSRSLYATAVRGAAVQDQLSLQHED